MQKFGFLEAQILEVWMFRDAGDQRRILAELLRETQGTSVSTGCTKTQKHKNTVFANLAYVRVYTILGYTWSVSAKVYLTEDFNYTVGGRLGVDVVDPSELPFGKWGTYSGSSGYITLVDDNLTHTDYATVTTSHAAKFTYTTSTFGISKNDDGAVYTTEEYAVGTTILLD